MFRRLNSAVRTVPKTTALVLVLLILSAASAGVYAYALRQWTAAQQALADERTEEAAQRLKICLFIWRQSVPVHLLAARAARLNGDYAGAEAQLKRCLKLHGGATAAIQLEFLLLRAQTGETDEVAPALLEWVQQKHPETPLILETLSRAYMHNLRLQPAYACLSRWIEATPNAAKPHQWRGWVYERLNNSKKAMEDYQRALELDPELDPVRLRVAEMLLEDNDPLGALQHLERLQREFPNRPDILARMGQCHFLQGEPDEARRLLEAAVKELPNDLPILIHLAKLELQENRPVKAEQWLRQMLEVDPTDTEAHYTMIAVLQAQGRAKDAATALADYEKHKARLDRANKLLRQEAHSPTKDPSIAAEIGALMLDIGRDRIGLYWLDQALDRSPAYQPALKALAEYYEKNGDKEKAAAYRRRMPATEKGTN